MSPDPRFPFPSYPKGWFAVAFSDELAPGDVRPLTVFGRELVLFRTRAGQAAVLDAFCPHMGAHLGHGGTVVGDSVRCPMHAFRFDGRGECVATGYGTRPPPKCKGSAWHVTEKCGGVFVWNGPGEPGWDFPAHDLEAFSPLRTRTYRSLESHPQETTENSVDIGHLAVVHGYEDVGIIEDLSLDGPYLTTKYQMTRRPIFPGTPAVRTRFHIHVWGLGYSFVEVDVPSHKMKTRQYVFATPNDEETITLRIAMSFKLESALRRLPMKLLDRVIGPAMIASYEDDVTQDFDIWTNKRYVHPPALAEGDGPVGKYRRWARQFYPPDPAAAADAAE